MKLLSKSIKQPLAPILALASTAIFSVAGVAYAQYGDTSGQGSSAGQSGSAAQGSSKETFEEGPFPYDILEEPVDTGYVDQQKRLERAHDPASPSPDPHVPDFPVDKEGKPLKDPMYQQGGPIGPN
ncbi:hypothetical protein [Nitrosovibrio sp. Nv6]|uniref:hypothetical protein n=1 Tax=Nitrosovibrio sp. Nv6 TaxID=1855340 RepID=UPI0008BD0BA2|nr:hypothetical protein [Nitrosovibrio sp. Nv6]SEO43182.1 hypothetical protein SAMN05216316_0198 [Nitrosovibrio sp. Nv6]